MNSKQKTTITTKKTRKPLEKVDTTAITVNATATAIDNIIKKESITTLAERISIKALKTCYQKSGQPFIYQLYCGLVKDILAHKNDHRQGITDGYDIVLVAIEFLLNYLDKSLDDIADGIGQGTDKDGNPIAIKRACFRAVNKYIMSERQHDYKRVYIDDIDPQGNILQYVELPTGYDIDDITTYKIIVEKVNEMKLTDRQKLILKYRLQGFSNIQIAKKLGITKQTMTDHMKYIQKKATAIDLTPHN